LTLSACSTIVSDSQYSVKITSTPSGASFTVLNKGTIINEGNTPSWILLNASDGYFQNAEYKLIFKYNGYKTVEYDLKGTLDGWYLGNIIFGGPIGLLIVDPLTGAMFQLPRQVHVNLPFEKGGAGCLSEPPYSCHQNNGAALDTEKSSDDNLQQLNIITIDSLSEEQRSSLKQIN
jgi:hypothetical protein